jgi:peroxiredoxin
VVRAAWLALGMLLALTLAADAAPAAPAFRVKLLDAPGAVDSRELIGKTVVVLRFQASYCRPCAKESAGFGRLVQRYSRRGVQFLAVHVQDTAADTRAFIRAHRVTYPVALDPRLALGNRFGFRGTPYTVVIDRKGEMVAQIHGLSAVSRLPRILDAALGGDRGTAARSD